MGGFISGSESNSEQESHSGNSAMSGPFKGMKNLCKEATGMVLFFRSNESGRFWQDAFGHVESAKGNIDTGKHHCKVFIHGFHGIRVVPSVLNGAHQNIPQRTECPSCVRVNEEIPDCHQDCSDEQHSWVY